MIQAIDIVEYISNFVDLQQRGDEWWGLSCFKDEKTPSFSVRRNPPVFFDYSSGIGGNVFTFVRYYNNCSAKEAVEILKKYLGVIDENDTEWRKSSEKMVSTMICKQFSPQMVTQKPSVGTVLPKNCMEKYKKDAKKLAVWEREGISPESLDKFQVYYDDFSNRLVYPITNLEGKIVNIGGRTLDPDWKEKGQRKYCYFYKWGRLDTLYGLYENKEEILKKKEIIIFEGCKSVLIANSWGIGNTAALLTSHLNPHQMQILVKLGVRVVFALDNDVNIRDDHNIVKLRNYVNVEYIQDRDHLLDLKDSPVDKGEGVFKLLYSQRKRY